MKWCNKTNRWKKFNYKCNICTIIFTNYSKFLYHTTNKLCKNDKVFNYSR